MALTSSIERLAARLGVESGTRKIGRTTLLRCYAKKLKLSMKQFTGELQSGVHKARARADFLGGVRSGVNGTPTFFINGQRHEGGLTFNAMVTALLNASRSK